MLMDQMQPGQVITPQSETTSSDKPQVPAWHENQTETKPETPIVETPVSSQPQPPMAQSPSRPDEQLSSPAPTPQNAAPAPALSWSAAEYLHRDKHPLWYITYIFGTLLVAVVVYFTTKDVLSTGIVFVAILGLVMFAARKPKLQDYAIDGQVLHIGQKAYYLHDFKAFSAAEESGMVEITLHPLKRLMPPVSVYVTPEQADELGDHLADFLSFEQKEPDAVDNLLRRIRF